VVYVASRGGVEIPLQIARKKIHSSRDVDGVPSVISSNYFEIEKRTINEKRTVIAGSLGLGIRPAL
jgi:hypothetical protein